LDSLERVKLNIDGLDVQSILRNGEACPNLAKFLSVSSVQGIDEDFDHLKEQIHKINSEGIRQAIDFIMDGTEDIETAVTNIEENDWILRMFLLVLSLMTCFMIFAACYEWSGRCHCLSALTCISELFILPTFAIAIICCWIATSALAFASIFNSGKFENRKGIEQDVLVISPTLSDFCSGNSQQSGPGGTVMEIFEERGITSNDMIFTAFTYYQSVRLRTSDCLPQQ
jgi:hypothetical protein